MEIRGAARFQSLLLLFGFLGTVSQLSAAQADHNEMDAHIKYDLGSLCGNYGIVGAYSGGIARALGTQTMDGHGKLTASAIINEPGPNNTRIITPLNLSGTYTVNPDGTGSMALTITLQGGTTVNVTEDFVITRNKVIDGTAIAAEIQDAQEVPSIILAEPTLAFHTYTLRSVPKSCRSGQ
jgi:hypothetical protein